MARSPRRYGRSGLISRRSVTRITKPYLALLGRVMDDAVRDWNALASDSAASASRGKIRPSAKASTIHDFIKDAVSREFEGKRGVTVKLSGQDLVVEFADGEVRMRFGKAPLKEPKPQTKSAMRRWRQVDAETLPGMPRPTWVNCRYELDRSGSRLLAVTITCSRFGYRLWAVPVPVPSRGLVAPTAPVETIEIVDIPLPIFTPARQDVSAEVEGRD